MAVDKKAVMKATLEQINKNINKAEGDVCDFYDNLKNRMDVKTYTTGSIAVDNVLGGGFAKGRVVEIVGMSSSGKTTLALTAVAHMQQDIPDANILYVDAENALDPEYARSLGVNIEDLIIFQPSSAEVGYEVIETFIKSGVADLVVVDSLAFMLPKALIDMDYGDEPRLAEAARLNARSLPRITKLANQYKTSVIIINQWKKAVRINPYDVGNGIDGNMYQPGGNNLHFLLTQMVEIKRAGQLKNGNQVVSNRIKAVVKKNKIGAPYREAEFVITFGEGLDRVEELIGLGLSEGIIKQAGSFYTMPDINDERFQGRGKLSAELKSNTKLADQLEKLIKEAISGKRVTFIAEVDSDAEESDPEMVDGEMPEE